MIKKVKSKVLFSLICTLSTTVLVGCTYNGDLKGDGTFTELYSELDTFSSNKYKKYNAIIKDFNLGKRNFEGAIDIEMKGLVSVPKERENAPVLIILAGNENLVKNENGSNKKLYKGYDYLAKSLAESGFLTLVIDTQFKDSYFDEDEIVEDKILEQLFDYHVDSLKKSINGENIYGINLKKKGDMGNIGLIGQSSTARNIFNICDKKYNEGDTTIKGLLSITPGESLSITSAYPDVPTSILVAEHSLNTKIGFDIYNEIERSIDRKNFASLTYLIGGDSKKFNQRIEEDKILEAKVDEIAKVSEIKSMDNTVLDVDLSRSVDAQKSATENAESIITEEKILMDENTDLVNDVGLHENFLSSYCASFFKTIFNEDDEFKNIFLGASPSPSKMYGMNVLNKYYNEKREVVYSAYSNSSVKKKRITEENVVESNMSDVDTAVNFNEPTTTVELKLKRLNWEKGHPRLIISSKESDYSQYSALNLRWAVNSSSSLNLTSQKVATVTLEDKDGKFSSVVLNSENALRKIEGREKKNESGVSNWSRYTPLSDSRIPISEFKGIDIKNIKKMTLSFDNSDSGSIYIDEISLVN